MAGAICASWRSVPPTLSDMVTNKTRGLPFVRAPATDVSAEGRGRRGGLDVPSGVMGGTTWGSLQL
jgi:hypothetical protein